MTVVAARCYAELATLYPHAGGQYVFLREAFGPLAGFLYGWTLLLVIQTGTIAAVAVAKFTAVLVPALGTPEGGSIVKPEYTWPGFVLVALGVPVFFVWRGRG